MMTGHPERVKHHHEPGDRHELTFSNRKPLYQCGIAEIESVS